MVNLKRKTSETNIDLSLELYGNGSYDIETGIGFFNHMLEALAKNALFDLNITASGDLNVDTHHTVEDVGIVLGKAIEKALTNKTGIRRYGYKGIVMDDAFVICGLDFSGRSYFSFDYEFKTPLLGSFESETVYEFFKALADNAKMTIHIKVLEGFNTHHIIEAMFKSFARAILEALEKDERFGLPSTKGLL